MNPLIELKKTAPLLLITITLHCFALLPQASAIVPPPDGCYPNFTTAEGCNALQSLTSGTANTAVGWRSLFSNTDGSFNTGIGTGTLLSNTSGSGNTAVGAAALLLNTGSNNTAVGAAVLAENNGLYNNAFGYRALFDHGTGNFNNAFGSSALLSHEVGFGNNAFGDSALAFNINGSSNTAVGHVALINSTGDSNTALGAGAGSGVTTASNVICIGVPGADVDNSCYIGNIYGASIDPTNSLVGVDLNGKLGVTTSARRFKRDIQPMKNASEAILALKPVRFHYKGDVKSTPCFGLVAEDVEKVNPDLVVRDKNGEPLSVRYEQINAMLLNEFLKEHRKNEEQQAIIARLQKQIEALTAGLQKVSAQLAAASPSRGGLELSKAEPEVAVNNTD
jgi:hypothetical protein